MPSYVKPPIGVRPHWYVHNERIKELAEAINRFTEHISAHQNTIDLTQYYESIAEWAKEIECLAKLEAALEKGGAE